MTRKHAPCSSSLKLRNCFRFACSAEAFVCIGLTAVACWQHPFAIRSEITTASYRARLLQPLRSLTSVSRAELSWPSWGCRGFGIKLVIVGSQFEAEWARLGLSSNGRPALIDYWESPMGSQFEAQWARLGLSSIGRAGSF